jgi:UDP-glucose 4-epimerase
MNQTILLTGGAGFIGSHVAAELLEQGWDVVIADDLSNARADVIDRLERITGRRPAFYRISVSDRAAMDELFSRHTVDTVIHLAGFKAVGESVAKPLAYYRNNLDTTLTLLETMAAHGVKRIIFSSSATVYGEENPVPYREDMPRGSCTNPYGWTKSMIEQILADACAADEALSAVCLRYFNPVGAHESGLIGELPNGIPNNLMPYITQTAAGIRQELSVFGDDYPTPDGTGVRDFIHVVDLARGHVAAIGYAAQHTGWEAINLGTGRGTSVLELVHTFEQVNGVSVPHRIGPRRPGDLASCYAAADKAERLLHWRAEKTVADMCRDAWRWQVNSRKL